MVELTKEEKAFLTKITWKALISPTWKKDDLIDFGKAIFSKKSLREMNDATFEAVFPFLGKIAESIGQSLAEQAQAQEEESKKAGQEKGSEAKAKEESAAKSEAEKEIENEAEEKTT